MSVYICVLAVGIIYLILIPLTLSKMTSKIILISAMVIFALYIIFIYPNFKDLLLLALKKMDIKY